MDSDVIAFSSKGKEDVKKTIDELEIEYVLIPGPLSEIYKAWGVYNDRKNRALPATFIVDKTGTIRWRYIGKKAKDRPKAKSVIEQLGKLQQ